MKQFKSILCILLALVMVFALVGCGKTEEPAAETPSTSSTTKETAPAGDGGAAAAPAADPTAEYVKLNIGVTNYMGRFIQGTQPNEGPYAGYAVFDQIFKADPETKSIVSDCLTDWYWEDDTTFIMVLNPNVVFSNGDKATSADLLYSYTSFFDRSSSDLSGFGLILDQCECRDDYTVALKFELPYRFVVNTRVNLIDKAWSESVGWDSMDWYTPVGSGPYTCTEYVTDDHMILKARDDYWNAEEKGPIYVDEYYIQYYKDVATMTMDLESGKIDFCDQSATDYSRFLKNGGDGYNVILVDTGVTQLFALDLCDFDYFQDKKMREAVAVGVDWEEVSRASVGDLYKAATSTLPENSPYYVYVGQYEYDLEGAKALMEECGYGDNNRLQITTIMMDTAANKSVAENLQFQLSQFYIDVEVQYMDVASAAKQWSTPGTCAFGFNGNPHGSLTADLYDNLSRARMQRNYWFYRDIPEFNDLFEQMTNTVDEAVWTQAMKDLQQLIFDEIIYIPIYEAVQPFGYRTDKLTEEQIRNTAPATNEIQLDKLGYLSSWQ